MIARFPVASIEQRTMDGITFASKREMKRYGELKLLERAGKIDGLVLQPKFQTFVAGKPFCVYTADFAYVSCATGRRVIEDCKSSGTRKDAAYRLRKKAAELQYGIEIVESGV